MLLFAAACLLAFTAFGCTEKTDGNKTEAPSLEAVATSTADIDAAGGSVTIDITSNTTWYVFSSASWAKVEPFQGSKIGKVTVTCEANTASTTRSAIITIYAGTDLNGDGRINEDDNSAGMKVAKQSVSVKQAAKSAEP